MEDHIEPAHNDSPEAIQSSVFGEHPSTPSSYPEPPHLIRQNEEKFWTAGRRKIPSYVGSPWDFYEQLLKLGPWEWMMLCNDRTTLRVVECFTAVDTPPDKYPIFPSSKSGIQTLLIATSSTCFKEVSLLLPNM
jgi:hypothetical protein